MLPHVCLHWDGTLEDPLFTPNLPAATCTYTVVLAAHLRRMTCGDNLFGFCRKTDKMHQRIKFILFWNDTLHVSDGPSVHRQEFKSVHTATGICQTDTAVF